MEDVVVNEAGRGKGVRAALSPNAAQLAGTQCGKKLISPYMVDAWWLASCSLDHEQLKITPAPSGCLSNAAKLTPLLQRRGCP